MKLFIIETLQAVLIGIVLSCPIWLQPFVN